MPEITTPVWASDDIRTDTQSADLGAMQQPYGGTRPGFPRKTTHADTHTTPPWVALTITAAPTFGKLNLVQHEIAAFPTRHHAPEPCKHIARCGCRFARQTDLCGKPSHPCALVHLQGARGVDVADAAPFRVPQGIPKFPHIVENLWRFGFRNPNKESVYTSHWAFSPPRSPPIIRAPTQGARPAGVGVGS